MLRELCFLLIWTLFQFALVRFPLCMMGKLLRQEKLLWVAMIALRVLR